MTDYTKLVAALRYCAESGDFKCGKDCPMHTEYPNCLTKMDTDAADAIEALQAAVERLKDSNEELRERQTYIDHYGDKWMTSAKDVPTAAYEHGYADGRDEAEAQLPKRGKWYEELFDGCKKYQCSNCLTHWDVETRYCPFCGAKMNDSNASNALNALDNAQDGPIITPCCGCSDYDGYGGCKSKGGCARAKMEVQDETEIQG